MENETHYAEAVIDNGSFGTRTIRFETGRLAKQAAGSAVAYLDDDTMVLSATTASKKPKDKLDFFPLTVDVEERMYAAGKIPGSFFRREGRPSEDAILTCRLIDRPLRPSFKKGLRNEIQVVATIMALNPDHLYDVVAINAASASTQLAGLPFSGPIGGVRVALINGQWVAFPTHTELEDAVFDMVVAGRVLEDGDVAIMMVEAEATEKTIALVAGGAEAPTEEIVAAGLDAAKPFIKVLCKAQADLAAKAAKPDRRVPGLPRLPGRRPGGPDRRGQERALPGAHHRRQAGPRGRAGPRQGDRRREAAPAVRGPREGDLRRVPLADQVPGPRARHQGQGPHRRPRRHGHPYARRRGRGHPARARLGAVRAWRDPDPGRHHPQHAPDGAAAGHPFPGDPQALHAQLQLPAVLRRRDRPRRLPEAPRDRPRRARRARDRAGPARRARSSRTRSVRCPRPSAPTARRPWARSAPPPCRC